MNSTPLAERIRPSSLDELIGQTHLTGKKSILRTAIENGKIPSMILWGPPGTGKTTIANIIANTLNVPYFQLSAISAGVKDVREVIESAKQKPGAVLFIDEIHRFNKGQQDALLGAVEKGIITLIGATTENPSFEVNAALLSRCQVYVLKPLMEDDLRKLIGQAIEKDEWLRKKKINVTEYEALFTISGGDARKLLNLLELCADVMQEGEELTDKQVMEIAQQRIALYDKAGEQHYDIISAFIKSIRGSDPNAAIYWLARMMKMFSLAPVIIDMLSARWKIYRVLNYILLAGSSIIFLIFARQLDKFRRSGIEEGYAEIVIVFIVFSSVFVLMIISSLINIFIMSKTFPDKLLTPNQNRSHIFSIVLNALAFVGLFVALISLLKEIADSPPEEIAPSLFILAILIVLLVVLVFVFVCQVLLKKYLRSRNEVTVKSMIDSIGKEI